MYCPKCKKEIPVTPPKKGERCPACRTKLWSRRTAFWNLPGWLRVLMCIPVGIAMLVVYLSLFNEGNLIITDGVAHIPAFALLLFMYVVLAWVKGKLSKGFARVMLITVLIVAGWALIFVVMPTFMDGVTWLMNRLFRLLKKWKLVRIYKKGTLVNTYELAVMAHAVIAVEALILHFAVRNRLMKPGIKPVLMVTVPLEAFWWMYLKVVTDTYKDLRKVKIKEFIKFWMTKAFDVELATVLIVCGCVFLFALVMLLFAKRQRYTDSDLMAIRKFVRVRVVGYYLLKAKLDGMVEHAWKSGDENAVAVHTLRSAEVSAEEREAYCAKNPQVAGILEYLDSHEDADPADIVAVLRDVDPEPGDRTGAGLCTEKCYLLVKRFALAAALVCAALVWMPGFMKYMICEFLAKTADDIMLHVVLFAPVFLLGLGTLLNGLARLVWKLGFRKNLLRLHAARSGNGNQLLLTADSRETPFSEEEITRMLRAYTLRAYNLRDCDGWDHQPEFFRALLGAVEDMASVAVH